MRTIASRVSICLSVAIITIILLPIIVTAQTQEAVTEIADFPSSTQNNNELVNIANETVTYNIDTWNPRPEGIFVGGTVKESLMQLNEIGVAARNELMIGTIVKFSSAYLSSGSSQFVIRAPIYIEDNSSDWPLFVTISIYQVTSTVFSFSSGGPLSPGLTVNEVGSLRAAVNDAANFIGYASDPVNSSIFTDISHGSWVSENRLYARIIAPVKTDEVYLLVLHAVYPTGIPFKIYWHASDLCSDGYNLTRVSYTWNTAPDRNLFRDYPVAADAGWSFVFQMGIGGDGRDWSYYYEPYSVIHWYKWVKADRVDGSGKAYGAFTFVMEFRKNSTIPLEFNLTVDAVQPWGSGGNVHLLSANYWKEKDAIDVIIAGNPTNQTMVTYSGWIQLEIFLQIQNAGRVQMMLEYDRTSPTSPTSNYFEILRPYSGYPTLYTGLKEQEAWFAPWCTAVFANSTWNRTDEINPNNHKGFWDGVGRWWDKHWVDVVGCLLIVAGAVLIVTGVGAGFGIGLIATGIGMLLYQNWPAFHNAVDKFVGMVIDAIQALGNWLYKLGMWIWKALTWLVDQIVYYGSIILGLLMVGGAMALLVLPLTWEMKILGAFEALVRGDVERAQRSLGEATTSMRRVGGIVSGGRL